jgi:transposase
MNRLIILIIGLAIIGFFGYRYFKLDQNQALQESIKKQDLQAAELAIKEAVSSQIQSQAKQYFHDHNNYFVSKSNNICTSIQANFDVIKKIADNPVECHAKVHSFTARMKSGSSFICVDTNGFSTIALNEAGYTQGVQCK